MISAGCGRPSPEPCTIGEEVLDETQIEPPPGRR
jgi:hypothetical protein